MPEKTLKDKTVCLNRNSLTASLSTACCVCHPTPVTGPCHRSGLFLSWPGQTRKATSPSGVLLRGRGGMLPTSYLCKFGLEKQGPRIHLPRPPLGNQALCSAQDGSPRFGTTTDAPTGAEQRGQHSFRYVRRGRALARESGLPRTRHVVLTPQQPRVLAEPKLCLPLTLLVSMESSGLKARLHHKDKPIGASLPQDKIVPCNLAGSCDRLFPNPVPPSPRPQSAAPLSRVSVTRVEGKEMTSPPNKMANTEQWNT